KSARAPPPERVRRVASLVEECGQWAMTSASRSSSRTRGMCSIEAGEGVLVPEAEHLGADQNAEEELEHHHGWCKGTWNHREGDRRQSGNGGDDQERRGVDLDHRSGRALA